MIAAAAALAAAAGCERREAAPRSEPPPSAPTAGTETAPADPPRPTSAPPLAYPSSRCGDCHGKMYEEWGASAHAQALS
ncbi:MAG TPA: hypothetical protein VKZ63_09895, partial [Kofleriaceae bacterium]|nr:hypothetical protein [Kofleriaceae bacterium]